MSDAAFAPIRCVSSTSTVPSLGESNGPMNRPKPTGTLPAMTPISRGAGPTPFALRQQHLVSRKPEDAPPERPLREISCRTAPAHRGTQAARRVRAEATRCPRASPSAAHRLSNNSRIIRPPMLWPTRCNVSARSCVRNAASAASVLAQARAHRGIVGTTALRNSAAATIAGAEAATPSR